MHQEPAPQAVIEELQRLHVQLQHLLRQKSQVELSVEIITEHADAFEADLLRAQQHIIAMAEAQRQQLEYLRLQVDQEQQVRQAKQRELEQLQDKILELTRKKENLEISLETITEHADLVESQLLETQNTLELKVIERTREMEEKNRLLEDEIQQRSRAEVALRNSMESAEQAREAAEAANRAKSAFLAKMSHELRTPLNAVIGYSEILQDEAIDQGYETIVPDLQSIQTAGEHLLSLINDVLDISRIEAEQIEFYPSEFKVQDMLNTVVTLITPTLQENQLKLDYSGPVGTMFADATRVQQILQNLLNNAVKFTHGGVISLGVVYCEPFIEFSVTDTGIGIAEEQLNSIFDAFNQADNSYTRRYDGMGIGLTICKQLCRLMGGEVTVKSKPGEGSQFTVVLPLRYDPEPGALPAA